MYLSSEQKKALIRLQFFFMTWLSYFLISIRFCCVILGTVLGTVLGVRVPFSFDISGRMSNSFSSVPGH